MHCNNADVLTCVRSLNKTDVLTLLSHFGSVAGILTASIEQLSMCPGFGEKKVRRLWEALHAPISGDADGGASASRRAGQEGSDEETAAGEMADNGLASHVNEADVRAADTGGHGAGSTLAYEEEADDDALFARVDLSVLLAAGAEIPLSEDAAAASAPLHLGLS